MAKIDIRKPAFLSRQVSEARLFFRRLQPSPRGPLRAVCGGVEHCRPDYLVERSGFAYGAVELLWTGAASGRWKGRPFALVPGMVFAYGPRVPHRISADARRPPVKYFVDFTGRDAPALLAPLLRSGPCLCARPEAARALFEELLHAGRKPGRSAEARCAALLRALLLMLSDECRPPERKGGDSGRATYLRVQELIERRAGELATLRDLARAAHLTSAYLCRLFRAHGAESPYRVLQRARFGRAVERLLQPGARVKDAAADAGMTDPYQFSRAFKRIHGVSPRAFQQYRGVRGPAT